METAQTGPDDGYSQAGVRTRLEKDSIGVMRVPADAYYGVQTLRAAENFDITGRRMDPEIITALAMIKKAAAVTNRDAGSLDARKADAIIRACDEIIGGGLRGEFIVDPVQGGAGTSANMNANEVIANRALELLGRHKGEYAFLHPNDDVNMAQSTNDVFPTAGKLAAIRLIAKAEPELRHLQKDLEDKAAEFSGIIKMGRTQLQDAVPVSLGQSFRAYASMVGRGTDRMLKASHELRKINLGGTAIGTAVNVSPYYLSHISQSLSAISGVPFSHADDLIDATQNSDSFAAVSGSVKALALSLSKMCNDLRLLSSGPKTGIGEINLPPRQNGSSIMPGKINPVIPEVVTQAAFAVIGNDQTITLAAEAGQLELNAFEPIMFERLLDSIKMITNAVATLDEHCIRGITANPGRCAELLSESTGTAVALCPYIGYEKSAEIAKAALATGEPVLRLVAERNLLPGGRLLDILDPARLAFHRPYRGLSKKVNKK